jgi:apolipoprotein N-acyltransferase
VDSTARNASIGWLIAGIACSSLALFFGTGLHPRWWLTWLMPIPVLLVAPRLSAPRAFFVAVVAWFLGSLNMWHYFQRVLGVSLLPVLVFLILPGCFFGLGVLLFRRWLRGGKPAAAAVGFAAFWVAYEYALASISIHSTFGNLGYTQMNFLPILQVAALTGIWGISFCMMLFAATAAALLSGYGSGLPKSLLATGIAIFLVAVIGFGKWRLHAPQKVEWVSVGLLASDLPQNAHPSEPQDAQRLMSDYAAQVQTLLKQGAQVVVAPEKIVVVQDENIKPVDDLFAAAASASGSPVVIGVARQAPKEWLNEARVYTPGKTSPLMYEKHHMLPPFESKFTVGNSRTLLQEPSGLWGVTICKDMDFPGLSREYGRDGVGLLLVPAWDFDADGWLHGRMAILRGVEDGFSIARAPRHGILSVSDSRGRVLAEQSTTAAPFSTILTHVPVRHEVTLYSRAGNWFAWCCIALFLGLLLFARPRPTSAATKVKELR